MRNTSTNTSTQYMNRIKESPESDIQNHSQVIDRSSTSPREPPERLQELPQEKLDRLLTLPQEDLDCILALPQEDLDRLLMLPQEDLDQLLTFPQEDLDCIPALPQEDLDLSSQASPQEAQNLSSQTSPQETQNRSQTPSRESSVWRDLLYLILKIVVLVAIFALIFTFLYGLHRNTDPDMAPMVKDGDLLMFYRLDKEYSIGDILMLEFEGKQQARRVVARAGDTVDITEDGLIVNGAIQQEPGIYQQTPRYDNGITFPLTIGEGQVFVLGDARENATDSRIYGPIDTEDTLGTVITVIRRRHL